MLRAVCRQRPQAVCVSPQSVAWTRTRTRGCFVSPSAAAFYSAHGLGVGQRMSFATGKTYFLRPWPRYTPHDLQNWADSKRHRNPTKDLQRQKRGPRLTTNTEKKITGTAKRYGFLQMEEHAGEAPCNEYYRYCFMVRRPYLALNKHGDEICVDLAPAAGTGKKDNSDVQSVETLKAAFQEVLKSEASLFVQTDPARQTKLDSVKEAETSDESMKNLVGEDLQYLIQTRKRSDSISLARRLYKTFFTTLGRESPQDLAIQKEERKASRQQRRRSRIEKRIFKLANLKKPHPNAPPAALRAFIEQRSQESSEPPSHNQ